MNAGGSGVAEKAAEQWLEEFRARHGRPPRVLHVGNIANNAYLNAKALRKLGVEADVLCNDYYHIMGCPEWEDADVQADWGSDFAPNWSDAGVRGFRRPPWFYQGALRFCTALIAAEKRGDHYRARLLRCMSGMAMLLASPYASYCMAQIDRALARLRQAVKRLGALVVRSIGGTCLIVRLLVMAAALAALVLGSLLWRHLLPRGLRQWLRRVLRGNRWIRATGGLGHRSLRRAVGAMESMSARLSRMQTDADAAHDVLSRRLLRRFADCFPKRDALSRKELAHALAAKAQYERAFLHYDIVHCYGTAPIAALCAGFRPYVAYEHGTIRNIPFGEDAVGKLTALAYREADHVFITNCDNVQAVRKLGIERFSFIPHPVNEDWLGETASASVLRRRLEQDHDCNFIVLHPARQHWTADRSPDWEKANDYLIRGFARFVQEVNPGALAVFVEWGHSVEASKALLDSLGIADRVVWIRPQPNRALTRYIGACDVLADQFFLGAFGSLTPKAMACGKPVLVYLDEELHRWAFTEMPPVENVRTDEEIADALARLWRLEDYRQARGCACRAWYNRYHSMDRICSDLIQVYRELTQPSRPGARASAAGDARAIG